MCCPSRRQRNIKQKNYTNLSSLTSGNFIFQKSVEKNKSKMPQMHENMIRKNSNWEEFKSTAPSGHFWCTCQLAVSFTRLNLPWRLYVPWIKVTVFKGLFQYHLIFLTETQDRGYLTSVADSLRHCNLLPWLRILEWSCIAYYALCIFWLFEC